MCSICQSCENLFPIFPRECKEWNLVCRGIVKVSTPELLALAKIRLRALQTGVYLQNQCSQLEKFKSTNSSFQKDLVELDEKWITTATRTEATKQVLGKWSANERRHEII